MTFSVKRWNCESNIISLELRFPIFSATVLTGIPILELIVVVFAKLDIACIPASWIGVRYTEAYSECIYS